MILEFFLVYNYMLSFQNIKKGIPFAKVVDGKYNDRILFINPDSDKGENDISIPDKGHLVVIPAMRAREVVYITGPAGVGKSTWSAQYIYNFLSLFPDRRVFVFSRLKIDPILEEMGCIEIPINESINDIDIIRDLKNCLCLFDDIDTIPDKALREKVYAISTDILETGRHNNIYIIITSHLTSGNDRKVARTNLNEAQKFVFFPKAGNTANLKRLLKENVGIENNVVNEILQSPSRWVCVSRQYPQYYFHEKGARMISKQAEIEPINKGRIKNIF